MQDEAPQKVQQAMTGAKAKKQALLNIYKLWSAFTKGLRHTFNVKQRPINVPKIGTFYEEQGDHIKESVMKFIPSPELSGAVNAPYNPEQGQQAMRVYQGSIKLNWQVIATAAGFQSQDLAEALIYQVFQQAVHLTKIGNHVSIELKLGRLTMRQGFLQFKGIY